MSDTNHTLFHFDPARDSFEDLGRENGATHWDEAVLMRSLGYESGQSFRKALMRAKQACLALGIHCEDHFVLQPNGDHVITRFGCYLTAMNGDPRKPEVAAAQAYFATLAETFKSHIEHAEAIDRVLVREEISDGEKTLAGAAKRHGVREYGLFQHRGYMGLYNMSLRRLKQYKGLPETCNFLDNLGKTELAANLFRITQTTEKIKNEGIRGQKPLEDAAFEVGREVRRTMERLSGTAPEDLPPAEDIKKVRSKLKGTTKRLGGPKKRRSHD
jgi:DNA-damage-inducible protein D